MTWSPKYSKELEALAAEMAQNEIMLRQNVENLIDTGSRTFHINSEDTVGTLKGMKLRRLAQKATELQGLIRTYTNEDSTALVRRVATSVHPVGKELAELLALSNDTTREDAEKHAKQWKGDTAAATELVEIWSDLQNRSNAPAQTIADFLMPLKSINKTAEATKLSELLRALSKQ
ncbi:hypothetical protein PISL3812_08459 [Talaromyces islandicus]|uniref:Uncharacterized protein n=1 Tax=Talaromyces islandicus TaxID=28573 RepID=A0A0U1M8M5_TALIS|nr:hypothetical protein PISL3812_08459 [Talaromyces islandicus]